MPRENEHHVVYHHPEAWAACTANNGDNGHTWQWDDEILVGFTRGPFRGNGARTPGR